MSAWDIAGAIVWGLLTAFLWGTARSLNSNPDQLGTNADAANFASWLGFVTFAAFVICTARLMGAHL